MTGGGSSRLTVDSTPVTQAAAVVDGRQSVVERAVDRDPAFRVARQPRAPKQSWIGRHPALFAALVGFGGGFLIGFLPGDDAVFDDSPASFNGLMVGGVGALAGAIVGHVTK